MNSQSSNQQKTQVRSLINKGDFTSANRLLMNLCQVSPDAESLYLLGLVRWQMRDFAMAENFMKQAVNLQSSSDANWQGLGMSQVSLGKYADAITSFNQCLVINPKNVQAMNSLGNIYRETGKIDHAEQYFKNALKIQPNNAETLSFLGNIYLGKCLYDEAIKCYKKSIKKNPNYIDAHFNIGCAYQGLGQHEIAINHYRHAKKLNPAATQPVTAIANSLEKQGKNEEALKQINPLIKDNILTADIVSTYAKICVNTKQYADGIDISNRFLQTTNATAVSPILEQETRFSLGDLYNKVAEYEKAFQQYKIANEMRPYNYDRAAMEAYFESIKRAFPLDKTKQLPASSNQQKTPIFILGMPRSGTSLIEQILASHNEVSGAGELPYITDIANQINPNCGGISGYPGAIENINNQFLNKQSKKYINLLGKHGGKSNYITDKMPHNFLYIGLIKMLFPNSKIIHCLRDPLDICLSIYFHNFNSNHPYSDKLENLGHYYNLYRELMSHWNDYTGDDIFEISYEALLSEPEPRVREMLNFLDIEWQDNCMKFYENKRTVSTPSYTQVRQPLYKSSMKRWMNYENNIAQLKKSICEDYLL